MIRIIVLTIFVLSVNLLSAQTQFIKRTGGHTFTMEIPSYLEKRYDLNDAAYLQYGNTSKESYIIVIPDEKAALDYYDLDFENAEAYLMGFVSDYKIDALNRKLSPVVNDKIGSLNFAQVNLTWDEEDDYTFQMLITAIESPTHFYNILCWTTKDFISEVWDDFMLAVKSFKE